MPVSALKKLAEEVYIMGVVVRGETGHGFRLAEIAGQEGSGDGGEGGGGTGRHSQYSWWT